MLHFARTLTDTLRKVSITKEAMLLQTIREAEMKAVARIKEKEAACSEKEIKNDTVEESIADENDDQAMKTTVFEFHASRSKTTNRQVSRPWIFFIPSGDNANPKTHEHCQ